MSHKQRQIRQRRRKQRPTRRMTWWIAGAALLLIASVAVLLRPWSGRDEPSDSGAASGTPRLMVDQTTVDEGYVRFNDPVRTAFRLTNAGDAPLRILDTPQVQLVQGC
jgi:hypothetical protein